MDETSNFVEKIIEEDILNQTYRKGIATRFPPEPNGYMHLRHGKSFCLNFGLVYDFIARESQPQ
jgi:glutaminyl-tRNA synthetase